MKANFARKQNWILKEKCFTKNWPQNGKLFTSKKLCREEESFALRRKLFVIRMKVVWRERNFAVTIMGL